MFYLMVLHDKVSKNLTAFLDIFFYTLRATIRYNVQKVLYIELFIYFEVKIKFLHCIWSIWLFSIFIFI